MRESSSRHSRLQWYALTAIVALACDANRTIRPLNRQRHPTSAIENSGDVRIRLRRSEENDVETAQLVLVDLSVLHDPRAAAEDSLPSPDEVGERELDVSINGGAAWGGPSGRHLRSHTHTCNVNITGRAGARSGDEPADWLLCGLRASRKQMLD